MTQIKKTCSGGVVSAQKRNFCQSRLCDLIFIIDFKQRHTDKTNFGIVFVSFFCLIFEMIY